MAHDRITYVWTRNFEPSPKAQALGERLEAIRRKRGSLDPEQLVAEAHNDAILRPWFTWDDQKAAHERRLEQARQLTRSVCVKRINDVELRRPIRAFVSLVTDRPENSYDSIVRVLSDSSRRNQLLAQARAELESWRERYDHLTELSAIFGAVDRALTKLPVPKTGKTLKGLAQRGRRGGARPGAASPGKARRGRAG